MAASINITGRSLSSWQSGLWAEWLTTCLLWLKGYAIVARRLRTPWGEIDLVAHHKNTLVFVEVKKRQSLNQALYALQPRQQMRIQKAASYVLHHRLVQGSSFQARFDVVCWGGWSWPVHIVHAWSCR